MRHIVSGRRVGVLGHRRGSTGTMGATCQGCSPGEVRHLAGWLLRSCTKEVAFVGGKAYKRMATLENWAEFVVVECWEQSEWNGIS